MFFVMGLDVPSVRFRVLNYLPYLRDAGMDVLFNVCRPGFYAGPSRFRIRPVFHVHNVLKACSRLPGLLEARTCDVVIVQRELIPYATAFMERALSGFDRPAFVYDWDDAIHLNYPEPDSERGKVARILSSADLVLAGNRTLADYAGRFNENVEILPTPVDSDPSIDFDGATRDRILGQRDRFVVGWTGTTGTLKYIRGLEGALKVLLERNPRVTIRIHCNWEAPGKPPMGFPYEFVRWSADNEAGTVGSFDCGLMPLPDDPWTRGKCSLKILLYQSRGVPAIASPVGNNLQVISDGFTGLFASTEGEWLDRVESLMRDPELRLDLARNAHKAFLRSFATDVCAKMLIQGINRAVAIRQAKRRAPVSPPIRGK
jgi:glycosyltransferase involved in cell wall biosynthesis